jgi:hypothetical protein
VDGGPEYWSSANAGIGTVDSNLTVTSSSLVTLTGWPPERHSPGTAG